MNNIKYLKVMCLILVISFFAVALPVACSTARKPTPNINKDYVQNPRSNMNVNEARERKIAVELVKIKGIKNATVLTNNNTAYVGLDIAPNIESAATNKIKNEAITKVKNADLSITKVYVSSDVGVVTRLKKYAQDVKTGKPISGLINEIEEMFRRVMPAA